MYLSRVEIDVFNRKNLRELNHLGAYHSWVEDSFPEEREKTKENRTRKLWRIDIVNDKSYLLILSEVKPNLELLEKYGIKGSAEVKNYSNLLNSLKQGMYASFRIKLNTVISVVDKEKSLKRGRIVPVKLENLHSFFLNRTEKNGFFVENKGFKIVQIGEDFFVKDGKKIKIVGAIYEGILKITDLEKFKFALINGIGRKKAYGFGLLTVIPHYE